MPATRRQTILDLLQSARRHVVLSLFRCDDSRVLDELVATARRGINVKVLITPRARGWSKRLGGLVILLKGTGVDVKQYDGPWSKYHAKYIIVDNETAIIGSANLTRKCLEDTCDFLLLTRDSSLVANMTALFNSDWSTPREEMTSDSNRLMVGPDNLRVRTLGILDRAKYRIWIIDHRVSHPEVLLLIARKMRDGVRAQILGRGEVDGLVSHGKLVLVDDSVAIIGSASLSRPGLDVRREVAVTIEDPSLVGELSGFFQKMVAANNAGVRKEFTDLADDSEDDDDD